MGLVAHAQLKSVTFTYGNEEYPALSSVSLTIPEGQFVVLAGRSGSGKTTLLHHFKKELLPIGTRSGEILYNGEPLLHLPSVNSAQDIGIVFQNPENQMVMDTVIQELAFSLENLGYDSAVIQKRIAELISFLGFQDLLHESVHTLSGGQKQIVNLAAVLILQPKLLLLDEPTAQLDPVAAKEFLTLLKRIHEELGITIIMSEHRLDEVLSLADRLIFMEKGHILYDDHPNEVVKELWKHDDFRSYIPQIPRLFLEWGTEHPPFTVHEGKKILPNFYSEHCTSVDESQGQVQLEAKHVTFQYEKNSAMVLQNVSLQVHKGDWIGLVGKNGTGKSTFLQVLAGLVIPRRGKVRWNGTSLQKIDVLQRYEEIGYVSQHPYYHFTFDTVWKELLNRAKDCKYENPEIVVEEILDQFSIKETKNRHPHDCSGGEQQLVAICLALLAKPRMLLLDEPTKGLDPEKKEALGKHLVNLKSSGTTIVMATHDIEFAAKYVNRCVMLFDGQLIMEETPQRFFSENFFYTTSINRLVRKQMPYALTWEDVITCENHLSLQS